MEPWNLRTVNDPHLSRYRATLSLHSLTRAWLSELKNAQPDHGLTRRTSSKPAQGWSEEHLRTLHFLEGALDSGTPLQEWIEDEHVDVALRDLEKRAQIAQALTLQTLLKEGMEGVLSQLSWNEGKRYALATWSEVSHERRLDLRVGYWALSASPLFQQGGRPLLPVRLLENQCCAELLNCPHQTSYAEVQAMADPLCRLYGDWWNGFAFGWCEGSRVEVIRKPGSRCLLDWTR